MLRFLRTIEFVNGEGGRGLISIKCTFLFSLNFTCAPVAINAEVWIYFQSKYLSCVQMNNIFSWKYTAISSFYLYLIVPGKANILIWEYFIQIQPKNRKIAPSCDSYVYANYFMYVFHALYPLHCILFIVFFALYSMHCSLCIVFYA